MIQFRGFQVEDFPSRARLTHYFIIVSSFFHRFRYFSLKHIPASGLAGSRPVCRQKAADRVDMNGDIVSDSPG
jgi:hypothetical protein